jgi:hypothetical protein
MKIRFYSSLILILTLLIVLTTGLGVAEEASPELDHTIYLPGILKYKQSGLTITGKVISTENIPLGGITVKADDGISAITNSDGVYTLSNLQEKTYTVAPSRQGFTFSPASAQVVVPPSVIQLNFTSAVQCADTLDNGSFETTDYWWELPVTEYRAAYGAAQHHSGVQSIRTGIINPRQPLQLFVGALPSHQHPL